MLPANASFRHIFFSLALLASLTLSAQEDSEEIQLNFRGEIALFDALDSLRSLGINIAYSRTRLTNQTINVRRNSTAEELIRSLLEDRVISVKRLENQILITPYKPASHTISGIVTDAETGEYLIGATVEVEGTELGTTTNGYGYFTITLPDADYRLRITHVGYKPYKIIKKLYSNTRYLVEMIPKITELAEVNVSSLPSNVNVSSTIPSIHRISTSSNDGQIPYFLGEVDMIQNALLKPGIRAIGEDASGVHVRGGGVDQNLTLLDEATIYNPNHFYGLISVFNPEAVNNVRIFKGYIPPQYGGRSSSVIEVRQKEGNANKMAYSGGIGVLSARALVEGPIATDKSSFLFSARQSLLNLSLDDFASKSVLRNRIRFQDFNLKVNYKPNNTNTLYLSGYLGNDRNRVGLNSVRNWGNRMLNFRWNHLLAPKVFANFSAFWSEYNYRIESAEEPGAFIGRSKIADYSIKADFTYTFSPTNELSMGLISTYHRLLPGSREPFDEDAETNTLELENEQGIESAIYASHATRIGAFSFNYGFRFSMLHQLGASNEYIYENGVPTSDDAITDTISYDAGEVVKRFANLEPRLSANLRLSESASLKASYSRTVQYIHLISNTIAPAPTDIWKLSSTYIPPATTDHFTFGYYKNLKENTWELSTEVYYKQIGTNIQYKNGADLVFNENLETELIFSDGRAYGLELYLRKKTGRLKGWVSYTLSRSEMKLPTQDGSVQYVVQNHDKTHDFSTSWTLDLTPRISASTNFVFNTGAPVTLPSDKYFFEGNLVPHFESRNNARLPNYHRLDLSFQFKRSRYKNDGTLRKNRDSWILTFYNVYARKNAYSYFFRESPNNPGEAQVVKYSIFGTIIPSITYNFKF